MKDRYHIWFPIFPFDTVRHYSATFCFYEMFEAEIQIHFSLKDFNQIYRIFFQINEQLIRVRGDIVNILINHLVNGS